jgi:ATP-dependent DNA ligase
VPFPEWIKPMGATLTQERFTGPEWVFERKFDGIRLVAFRQGNDVRLLSRNCLPQNSPPVAEALKHLPVREIILDGEITWGKDGPAYHVFDLLWLDGRDVSLLPLDERHALLQSLPWRNLSRELRAFPMKNPGSVSAVRGGRELSPSGGTRVTSTADRLTG